MHVPEGTRPGLRGQVRRVLAPRGVEVRQKLQLRHMCWEVERLCGWSWIEEA